MRRSDKIEEAITGRFIYQLDRNEKYADVSLAEKRGDVREHAFNDGKSSQSSSTILSKSSGGNTGSCLVASPAIYWKVQVIGPKEQP